MGSVHQRGRQPLAEKIADWLQQSIELQAWIPGEKMPSSRSLAKRYGVSLNTAQAAIQILAERNLVIASPRRQAVVAHRPSSVYKPIHSTGGERYVAAVFSLAAEEVWAMPILQGADGPVHNEGMNIELFAYRSGGADVCLEVAERLSRLGDQLAGVIVLAGPAIDGLIPILDQRRVPWVCLNRFTDLMANNYVAVDNLGAGWLVGKCFARLGYERVAMLSLPPDESLTAAEKCRGFLQGFMEKANPKRRPALIECKNFDETEGYHRTIRYLEDVGRLDGIFTFGDYLAQGAVQACRRAGLSVPRQVGVVGGTGLRAAARFDPPLTVTTQPVNELGRDAALMLMRMLHTGRLSMPGQRIPCRLVVRESLSMDESTHAWLEDAQTRRIGAIQRWQSPPPEIRPIT